MVQAHPSTVANPVATVEVTRSARSVGGGHLEIKGEVAVSEDEHIKGLPIQHIPAMVEEPFALRSIIAAFGLGASRAAVSAESGAQSKGEIGMETGKGPPGR